MSSRLEKTFINKEAKEITTKDMLYTEILDSNHINSINKLRKQLRKSSLIWIIATTFVSFFNLVSLYELINSKEKLDIPVFILHISFLAVLIFLLIYNLKLFMLFKKENYKKAQYGIVHGKYTARAGSSSKKEHLVNVTFTETNTYLRRVYCLYHEVHSCLNTGDVVLVVSFDGRNSYIVDIY